MQVVNKTYGTTALQQACSQGNEEQLKMFLGGLTDAEILKKDFSNETALHDAIRNGN